MVRYLFYTIGDLTYQSPLVGLKSNRVLIKLIKQPLEKLDK